MTKVMFDTNFLIDLVRFRIDIQDVKTMIGRSEFYTVDTKYLVTMDVLVEALKSELELEPAAVAHE